jgi:hypothetical protein
LVNSSSRPARAASSSGQMPWSSIKSSAF